MEDQKKQAQTRFIFAALLSIIIFTGWSYFFAPKPPAENKEKAVAEAPQPTVTPTSQTPTAPIAETQDQNPKKTVKIVTPLFEAEFDSKGAVARSWVLKKNVSSRGELELYANGSTKESKKPLELISKDAVDRHLLPFRLFTGDAAFDTLLNTRNYKISSDSETVQLSGTESKTIEFSLVDEANGLNVTKKITLRADSYFADVNIDAKRGGAVIGDLSLAIGASIGDQGLEHFTMYQVEPTGIAMVNGSAKRHAGTGFTYKDKLAEATESGNVDWAGIEDTYFAMIALPSTSDKSVKFSAEKYEKPVEPYFDGIWSWITRTKVDKQDRHLVSAILPVAADGSTTTIYVGTKDYFTLKDYGTKVDELLGRKSNFGELINYGFFSFITRWITPPIIVTLDYLYSITKSYGIALIIFTLIFYSLLFPLRWQQSKSFKKASSNAPKMKELQDKLKAMQAKGVPVDDPRMRELQMEQLRMTKDSLPIGGCLPMLLQFPLLFAVFIAVSVILGIRQSAFLWIPDLAAADPYHLLNFLFVGSMIVSMKFTPTAPAVTPEQQMQQKMMTYTMPLVLLWAMWGSPAGLLLYWCAGNVVSFGQQMLINKLNQQALPATT